MADRIEKLKDFLAKEPDSSFLKYALALEYIKLEDLDQALAYFLEIKVADPNYGGMYYHLGKLYELQEEWWAAKDAYNEGLEITLSIGDQHANAELKGALELLENSIDFEE